MHNSVRSIDCQDSLLNFETEFVLLSSHFSTMMWASEAGTPTCKVLTFIPVCKACWEAGAGECFWQNSELDDQESRNRGDWMVCRLA